MAKSGRRERSGGNAATTVIRPTMFGQHFLALSPALFSPGADAIHLPTDEGSVAFLDCRDIAACASALLLDPGKRAEWVGERFELTGPEALTGAAIATLLTQVAGRAISWVDGVDAFSARAAALGVSDGLKHIYAEAADGWFSRVETDAFQRITGRHPTSFAKLAFDHAAHFAGS